MNTNPEEWPKLSFDTKMSPQRKSINHISYREWLAGLAMQGFLASPKVMTVDGNAIEQNRHTVASSSVQCADALIAELEKEKL